MVNSSFKLLREGVEFDRIGHSAVKKAQEESRRLGVPNVYLRNGKLLYEKPDGELTSENLFEKETR